MRREQLEHVIRAAGTIISDDDLIVIGSQSVLGTFDEDQLPPEAMYSMEADLLPMYGEIAEKADLIDGAIGEDSLFHESYGYYAQGVDETTAVLPNGWRDRLRPWRNVNTRGVTGWCLEPHDLVVAKLVANRQKDHAFVRALFAAQLVDRAETMRRVERTTLTTAQREIVVGFLDRIARDSTER